jgi:ArsR family transcriptional regulator
MTLTESQFSRIAKAIADPRRFHILERIAAHPDMPCQELRALFPVTQPTMSHHLRELNEAGLVESRREGQCVHYRYRGDVMSEYVAMLEGRLAARLRPVSRRRIAG